jgi:hypothetical protein
MTSRSRLTVAALLLAALAARGDEAVRRDGTRAPGRLALSEAGRFSFGAEPVANLDRVRFAPKPPPPPPVPLWHQVHLGHGEVLLAEVRTLDDAALHVRPAWAAGLAVPRAAVEQVTNPPGWRPVRFDPFDGGPGRWTTTGGARAEGGRLVFDRVGRAAETTFEPLAAGRVGVTLRAARTTGRRLTLGLGFVRDGRPAAVGVELVGPGEGLAVRTATRADHEGRIPRDGAVHHLSAEFDRDRLAIFVDERVLWAGDAGPGELRSVTLVSDGAGTEAAAVDDVLVARPDPPNGPRAWADPSADGVRSPDGDETFGSLAAAGPTGVTLEVKGNKLTLGWAEVGGLAFRRGPVAVRATRGEHVRLVVRTADGLRDVLDGAVKAFDDRAVVLVHAVLGELAIPRDRVEEVRLRFHGRRVPIDTAPHHLGARPAFGFAVPRPEGLSLARPVGLDGAGPGFVEVEAASVGRTGTPAEVRVNGEVVGELNRSADRAGPGVRRYRLPVKQWRQGDNAVEVRLRPADGGRVTGIDVRAVRAERIEPR